MSHSEPNLAPIASVRNHIDEAVSILRATSDGDLLDPSDISLLQSVVNGSFDTLSDEGKVYWDKLVKHTLSGDYVKRWLCGVENMTRDLEGYVYWKSNYVEHFSHSDFDGMVSAACRLGAVCSKIEADGGVVNSSAVSKAFKDLDFGDGLQTPRFAVFWSVQKEFAAASVYPIESLNSKDADVEIKFFKSEYSNQYGAMNERHFLVCTKEDLQIATECIQRDHKWAQRNFWALYRNSDVLGELNEKISRIINPNLLISKVDLENKIIGGFLQSVSRASEELMLLDPLQSDRLRDRSEFQAA